MEEGHTIQYHQIYVKYLVRSNLLSVSFVKIWFLIGHLVHEYVTFSWIL